MYRLLNELEWIKKYSNKAHLYLKKNNISSHSKVYEKINDDILEDMQGLHESLGIILKHVEEENEYWSS